ncbi:hypothetical protein DBR42_14785 [Pelomonas sp. HMWF004]|nr:hypothetical protein DBR42_14785 [Pelomonas sp. HMWF004]
MSTQFRLLLLSLPLALCTGCSVVYDYVQDLSVAQCASNNSNPQDRRACEKRNAPNYDDYEARRKRMKEGQSS